MNGQEAGPPFRPESLTFVRRVLVVLGMILGCGLTLLVLWYSIDVWLMLFAGALVAIVLRGLSNGVSRWTRLPSMVSLILVILSLCGSLGLAGWLMVPSISKQFQQLSVQLPRAFNHLRQEIEKRQLERFVPDTIKSPTEGGKSDTVLTGIKSVFSATIQVIGGLLLIMFTGVYIAVNPKMYTEGLVRLFPLARRDRVRSVIHETVKTLRYWILGQLLSMTVVGVLIGLGLHILGIPLALSLGILAGVLDCIPIAGPVISAAPTVLMAFVVNPLQALYVILLYLIVVAVIESHLVLPIVQRFAVALPQVVTVVSLVMMGMLFGFLGVLLATPAAAAAFVVIRMVYLEDVLGDPDPTAEPATTISSNLVNTGIE